MSIESVQDAYDALRPIEAVKASIIGEDVTRQGDIFACSTMYLKSELREMGATFSRLSEEGSVLLHTNHRATEVATLPDGRQFARGTLYHKPRGRTPDHARRRMGDGKAWYSIHRNTVPAFFDKVTQNLNVRAWSGWGRVD